MGRRRLIHAYSGLLTMLVVACGAPDNGSQRVGSRTTDQRIDSTRRASPLDYPWEESSNSAADAVGKVVCPVPVECYSVQFPDSALLRPVALHRSFTGKVFVAVKADTARRQLTHFQLWAVRIHPRAESDSVVTWSFFAGKPVPDSLAGLLPQLEQHIRKLRPQVLVAHAKSCEMPTEWIIPVRVR